MELAGYKLITTPEELGQAVATLRAAPEVGFDTETTGLDPHSSRLRLIQLATPQASYVLDLFRFTPAQLRPVFDLLAAPQPVKVAHNAKFDLKYLLRHYGVRTGALFDTLLASQLVSAGDENDRHGLEAVALRYLDLQLDKAAQLSDWSGELTPYQLEYAAHDAVVVLPLRERLGARLEAMDLLVAAQLEFDCVPAVAAMELAGVYLDAACWREQVKRVREKYEAVAGELQHELGAGAAQMTLFDLPRQINLDSPAQVREALSRLGIELESTREWRMQKLARQHPVIQLLLEYRGLSKSLTSYGEGLLDHINPATGRLHANFHQIGTPTGRLSCREPNIQQVPHAVEYRSCFRAPQGRKLAILDYSQVELRILAEFSRDEALMAAFTSGADLHRTTASQMLGVPLDQVTPQQREHAKSLNYGIVYGMGAEGLANRINCTSEEAEVLIERYFAAYPGVARWLREATDRAVREGSSRSAAGRLWIFRLDTNDRQQLSQLKRLGKNSPIQSSASDIFKRAMKLVDDALLDRDAQIVNSIHDEIVVECAEAIAEETASIVSQAMTAAAKEFLPTVPVVVEAAVADAWVKN
jgi:DNA polymerase I-like protein with 3'-5' exonuclease and polymerase domains